MKLCLHQERYGIEILIESLFRDGTASWVRIVNGINKHVTETTETILFVNTEQSCKETCCQSGTTAEARNDTDFHFYPSTREKIDRHKSRKISSRLLRGIKSRDPIAATRSISSSREDDGAVRFDDITKECTKKFDGALQ